MVEQVAYPLRVAVGRVDVMKRPEAEAITLDLARAHCRIDCDDDDILLKGNIVAAREALETALSRPLLPQECRVRVDSFPPDRILLWNDVIEIVDVSYFDEAGVRQVLPPASYRVMDRAYLVARKMFPYGEDVQVRFRCGAFEAPDSVPESLIAWMLLQLGTLSEHRESEVDGTVSSLSEDFTNRLIGRHTIISI
ncbi:hypothetical protein DIE14_12575 [Burkholderia sp. Bp9017]|uniref:head-tail connector protein n=1 Tax=unclassified Burkholderia TaxID=2613784 RepID=UPI000F5FEBB7|nr:MULTISPECIES: head-tail connector protein [unclassified Burkholderia]RQZ27315.1 hypothetical protein DIE14_12575 [Burkholderia sp. Bp9017]RQZ34594.1 hypothetical protein DIE13_13555 [Burkholderia sp. Bp9016]